MEIINRYFIKDIITNSCHASSIVFYKNKLYTAWFGGSYEGCNDVCIYINNGNETKKIGNNINQPCWNPVLFVYDDDLYLFYKIGAFCDRWQTLVARLDENLNLLDLPQMLPAGLNGPVKTKPLRVENDIYCGSSFETQFDWSSYVEIYQIKNHRWHLKSRSNPLNTPKVTYKGSSGQKKTSLGLIQPALWKNNETNTIHMFLRSSFGLPELYYSAIISNNDPFIKKSNYILPLPINNIDNPNSSVDVTFVNNRLFLICNPNSLERSPLVIYEIKPFQIFSPIFKVVAKEKKENQASSWSLELDIISKIEIGNILNVLGCNTTELSYPYMIEHNGDLYISYSFGRSKIEICTVKI